ncbi:hypothetical protein BRC72_03090 [Halobacteriales archaeon QH_7_66_36]|nr:MAG: hypothetical protein BRC72_03090 [Halobacteriales archaeon QH_7_66_36]
MSSGIGNGGSGGTDGEDSRRIGVLEAKASQLRRDVRQAQRGVTSGTGREAAELAATTARLEAVEQKLARRDD